MAFLTALALSANNLLTEGPHHHDGVRRLHRHHRHRGHPGARQRRGQLHRAYRGRHLVGVPAADHVHRFRHEALMGMAVDGGTGDGGDATGEGAGDDPLAEMGLQGGKSGDENDPAADGKVPETRMVTGMFASLENNDLLTRSSCSSARTAATSTAT
ncbi:MAG: hypothetical protein ACLTDR_01480 [Adlercreutzia equolifaciens]